MKTKYIVFSNVISVKSDNILRIGIPEPILIYSSSSYFISTYSLLDRYKVYLSDPRECLCTRWRYGETYENFSIDSPQCRKNPIKKYTCHTKLPYY